MRLLELIPTPDTDRALLETVAHFSDVRLGKGIVYAKDTPNFIGNRIGTFSVLNVMRLMVRIIRTDRPVVIVSRFQGNARDGHGNHQTAGLLTQQAFEAAANPQMFPEQITDGLRPWQAKRLYIGGMREDEDWTVRVDTGQYSPWLGDSFENVAREGLSFQRSQNSGRLVRAAGSTFGYYKRMDRGAKAGVKERGFFDGIDTSMAWVEKPPGCGHSVLA